MSHFGVLVVGADIEKQLQPYHEFECTGVDDEYVQDIDRTADVEENVQRFMKEGCEGSEPMSRMDALTKTLEYQGLEDRVVTSLDHLHKEKDHKYGYVLLDASLPLGYKYIDRSNPNRKWDWFKVGGRWGGYFKLKANGAESDQARKDEIDFEGMRAEAAERARMIYRKFHAFLDEHELAQPLSWETVKNTHFEAAGVTKDEKGEWNHEHPGFKFALEQSRKVFNGQAAIKALAVCKDEDLRWLGVFDDGLLERLLTMTEDEMMARARKQAVCLFAMVKDSQWYERGTMGWWGCVRDEKDEDEWLNEFTKLIDNLPGDTLFTIVDCHI